MTSKWIIYGLIIVAILILMNLVGPFKGSTNADFPDDYQPDESNPIAPCPDSPNCVRLSIPLEAGADQVLQDSRSILESMGAETVSTESDSESNSQNLQIDAVFKIAVFGFRDDFTVQLTQPSNGESTVLHLSSRSRTGHGDLGVNRRRVNQFLTTLQSQL